MSVLVALLVLALILWVSVMHHDNPKHNNPPKPDARPREWDEDQL